MPRPGSRGIDAASLDAARGALQAFLAGLTGLGDPLQGLDANFQLGANLLQLHGDVSGTESLLGIAEPGTEVDPDDAAVVVRQVTAVLNIGIALGDSGHNVAIAISARNARTSVARARHDRRGRHDHDRRRASRSATTSRRRSARRSATPSRAPRRTPNDPRSPTTGRAPVVVPEVRPATTGPQPVAPPDQSRPPVVRPATPPVHRLADRRRARRWIRTADRGNADGSTTPHGSPHMSLTAPDSSASDRPGRRRRRRALGGTGSSPGTTTRSS